METRRVSQSDRQVKTHRTHPSADISPPRYDWKIAFWFCGITLVAFAIRWVFLAQSSSVVYFRHPVVDARAYWEWAGRIAGGDWLGSGVFYQAPLYPYFLAIVRRFITEDAMGVRLVQSAVGALGCGLIFLGGCRFASHRVGVIAATMLALFAPAVFFDGLIQKAVLDSFLMSALLLALAGIVERPTAARSCAMGVILGLLALTRENALVLIPVLLSWMWFRNRASPWRPTAMWGLAYCVGLAIPLGPVLLRNAAVGGEWALTTSQAGANFYIGNNPTATGVYQPLRAGRSDTPQERVDATQLAEAATGRTLTPREISHYWFGRAWTFIGDQPGKWLVLLGRKSLLLVNEHEVPDAEDVYFYAESSSLLRVLLRVGHYGILIPLAAAGMVLSWRRIAGIRVVHLVVGTLSLAIVAFFVFARYRHVLAPPLILFAAIGLVETIRAIRAGRRKSILVAATIAIVFAIPANWPLFDGRNHRATSYSNAGAALARAGDLPAAIQYYRRALELNAAEPGVHANLGVALGRMGLIDDAIAALSDADRLGPGDADTLRKLGVAYGERGDWQKAADYLGRAVSVDPTSVPAVTNLAIALMQTGRDREAIDVLRAGVKAQQKPSPLSAFLAWELSTSANDGLRNGPEAIRLMEPACKSDANPAVDDLESLAAAYAEAGRFNDAVAAQQRAVNLAIGAPNAGRIGRDERLRAYQSGRPWRKPR